MGIWHYTVGNNITCEIPVKILLGLPSKNNSQQVNQRDR